MSLRKKIFTIALTTGLIFSCASSETSSDHGKVGASSQAQVGSTDVTNGIYKEKIRFGIDLSGTIDSGTENLNLIDSTKWTVISWDQKTREGMNNKPIVSLEDGLNLTSAASAEAFSITVEDCSSAFTTTASETTAFVELYKQDVGCTAKLTSFTINGNTYTPRSALDCGVSSNCRFSTYANNEIAIFENAAGVPATDYLNVTVVSQLPSPLTTPSNIQYRFYRLSKKATTVLANSDVYDSSNGHALSVNGVSAPSFTMDSLVFNGINQGVGANGEGKFSFFLECPQNITGDGDLTHDVTHIMCKDVNFADIEYKLVEDTWGIIASNNSLTYAQAQGLFPGTALTLDDSGSSSILVHGGSHTSNDYGGITLPNLLGPSQMHLHPNMILILGVNISGVGYLSFEYFPISITTLSETQ